jgi:putative PIN family toxin of toxin-antitoxin system
VRQRVVFDTNVLVSALYSPGRTASLAWDAVLTGDVVPLYDHRTIAEHWHVLSREKLRLPPATVARLLEALEATGELVVAGKLSFELPDPKDVPFLEVAISGGADALVTGNARDFDGAPTGLVVSPREFLDRLRGSR